MSLIHKDKMLSRLLKLPKLDHKKYLVEAQKRSRKAKQTDVEEVEVVEMRRIKQVMVKILKKPLMELLNLQTTKKSTLEKTL